MNYGVYVASAGDVNGDGFDDLIVGAYTDDPAGTADAGASYVVFTTLDAVALDDAIFTGLVSNLGVLSASSFDLGIARQSGPEIVYVQGTGALYYDSNGAAAGGATRFATLSGGPTLDSTDFRVV